MRLPFTRKQQYILDSRLELFVEDRPRRRHYLILIPIALLLIVAAMSWYKRELDQDNAMQEALTSEPQSVHRLMAQADAAENAPVARIPPPRAAPVPPVTADTSTEQDLAAREAEESKAVEAAILDWKRAWETSDVDAYLAHYVNGFTPADGSSHAQWKALRRQRLDDARDIEIALSDLEISFESADRARVAFDQRYRSSTFTDNTHKVLFVRRHEGAWKIEREQAE